MGRVEAVAGGLRGMRSGASLAARRRGDGRALLALRRGARRGRTGCRSTPCSPSRVAAAAVYLVAINTPLLTLSLRGAAESATLPRRSSHAWQGGTADRRRRSPALTALLAPGRLHRACASTCSFPLSIGSKAPGFAWCVRVAAPGRPLEHGRGLHDRRPALAGSPRRPCRRVARAGACSPSAP